MFSHKIENVILAITLFLIYIPKVASNAKVIVGSDKVTHFGCQTYNYCNGHGSCIPHEASCKCVLGYGSPEEINYLGYRPSYDCSLRTCPLGSGWGAIPKPNATATVDNKGGAYTDKAHDLQECSGQGKCDREMGVCECNPGFRGASCNSRGCPDKGDCSGHGQCLNMETQARLSYAMPLSNKLENITDGYYNDQKISSDLLLKTPGGSFTETWDQKRIYGCVCDSGWTVGLGRDETQQAEYFGPTCLNRRCPSGDNPDTEENDLDCEGVTAEGGRGVGKAGNLCHVECSGKGLCNYKDGACLCFPGFWGTKCELRDGLALGS